MSNTLEEILSIATGHCDVVGVIIPLCNQKWSLTPWIQASVNLLEIARHFVHVGLEVVNIANGKHGLEVPSANFLYSHRWKSNAAVFSYPVVVGNLTTMTATLDV